MLKVLPDLACIAVLLESEEIEARDGFVDLAQVGGECGGIHKEFIRRGAAPPR
jgi:hypothetical protein